ncbi:unnamed protein product, partial [Ceratitis capitata]
KTVKSKRYIATRHGKTWANTATVTLKAREMPSKWKLVVLLAAIQAPVLTSASDRTSKRMTKRLTSSFHKTRSPLHTNVARNKEIS